MTAALLAAVVAGSAAVGAGIATAVTWWRLTIRYDLHGYHRLLLAVAKVREVYAEADHEHRLRCRWERRALEAREQVGELCIALAAERAHRRRRRDAVPAYGIHRPAHARGAA